MNPLKKYTLLGIIFVFISGTLSHFIYEWSGKIPFIGLFFPVNESTWEHMKLLFFPMLIYLFYMQRKLEPYLSDILPSLFLGLLLGSSLIPVLFYTYSGILGKTIIWIDIAIFYLSVLAAFFFIYRRICSESICFFHDPDKTQKNISYPFTTYLATIIKKAGLYFLVLLIAIAFFVFTFLPPDIGIFRSPA